MLRNHTFTIYLFKTVPEGQGSDSGWNALAQQAKGHEFESLALI